LRYEGQEICNQIDFRGKIGAPGIVYLSFIIENDVEQVLEDFYFLFVSVNNSRVVSLPTLQYTLPTLHELFSFLS